MNWHGIEVWGEEECIKYFQSLEIGEAQRVLLQTRDRHIKEGEAAGLARGLEFAFWILTMPYSQGYFGIGNEVMSFDKAFEYWSREIEVKK